MAITFKLKGADRFMKNLNKEIKALKGRTLEGLIHAVIELQREAEPGTPLDVGNLRSSWFSVSYKPGAVNGEMLIAQFTGPDASKLGADHTAVTREARQLAKRLGKDNFPVVLFGYTANYAVFVHENVGAKFKRPSARARWLYTAMQNARERMLQQIKEHARFK